MSAILEKLKNIQQGLKAPKNQFNKFGSYKYRNAEDILEAVKPLLDKNNCIISIADEIVNIGNRYYIKAEVKITDAESGGAYFTTAYAREEESKKGMDGAQITGASSSYARKYALNGLFAIDDTKDADATNQHDEPKAEIKKIETKKPEKKDENLDPAILEKIKNTKTVKELQELYGTLTELEQPIYVDKFSTRKSILTAGEKK